MPTTYEPIQTYVVSGSTTNSITLSSIAASWTDLRIVYVGTLAGRTIRVRFNSDTGANYSDTTLGGDGSSVSSGRDTSNTWIYLQGGPFGGGSGTIPSLGQMDIFSYAGSTYKTVLNESSNDQNGSGDTTRLVGLWRNTAAITSITISSSNALTYFGAGSTLTLYGIKNA
jgi:hypothetical protein